MGWNDSNDDQDPWRRKKQQDGPPDLDELFKQIQRKFLGLFGRKAPAGGESGGGSMLLVLFVLTCAGILWGLAGIFIVNPQEQAVVLRFGKYTHSVGPGTHWIPRFIDKEHSLNIQSLSSYAYNSQMLTMDGNIVQVAVAVQYRIKDTNKYLFNVADPNESLQLATASALRQIVGDTTLDQIMAMARKEAATEVSAQLNKILSLYNTGLEVSDVKLQTAKAPDEVRDAFDDVIKAQSDKKRMINEANEYANGVVPVAEGQAQSLIRAAQADREKVIEQAKGNIARYLALLPEYTRAPKVTRERLYLDTLETVLSHSSKVLIDAKAGNNMFYLPLDKFLSKSLSSTGKVAASNLVQSASTHNYSTPVSSFKSSSRAPLRPSYSQLNSAATNANQGARR